MNTLVASLARQARLFASLLALGAAALLPACTAEVDEGGDATADDPNMCDDVPVGGTRECEISKEWSAQGIVGIQSCLAPNGPDDTAHWDETCQMGGASTPLVLSFDAAPVVFAADAMASFDLTGGEKSVVTDWPAAETPWLALDRNGNAQIDDGAELFGSATRLSGGARAKNGFEALAELDSNGDGRISSADAAFASLRVWSDRNGNRLSESAELVSLASLGVASIELSYGLEPRCDNRGNCEGERASFTFVGTDGRARSGAVIDVHLAHR